MKKTKSLLIAIICMLAFVLSACVRMESSFVVHENNSATVGMRYAFNKEKADARLEQMAGESIGVDSMNPSDILSDLPIEKYNEVEYYIFEDTNTYGQGELKNLYPTYLINQDKFYVYATSDDFSDEAGSSNTNTGTLESEQMFETLGLTLEDIEYIGLSVKMPSKVEKTNGVIQADGQTVVWDYSKLIYESLTELELYAYTSKNGNPAADRQAVSVQLKAWRDKQAKPSQAPTPGIGNTAKTDKTPPVIKGIKKNKSYKKKVVVYVKDNVKLKKVTVNGKKAKLTKVKKGKYKGYYKFTVKKKGKKNIIAYDTAGNKKKVKIKIK